MTGASCNFTQILTPHVYLGIYIIEDWKLKAYFWMQCMNFHAYWYIVKFYSVCYKFVQYWAPIIKVLNWSSPLG